MMIAQAKVTAKGQITLPVRVIRRLGIHPGDKIAFEEREDHVEIQPVVEKISARDLPKIFGKMNKIKLSQDQLRKAREEAGTWRYKEYLKNNPTHKKPPIHESSP